MKCRYIGRLYDSLHNFSAQFSDIFAIRRLATERVKVKPKWWKRILPSFCRQSDSDSGGVLSFMATLDESQVIDLTVDRKLSTFELENLHYALQLQIDEPVDLDGEDESWRCVDSKITVGGV